MLRYVTTLQRDEIITYCCIQFREIIEHWVGATKSPKWHSIHTVCSYPRRTKNGLRLEMTRDDALERIKKLQKNSRTPLQLENEIIHKNLSWDETSLATKYYHTSKKEDVVISFERMIDTKSAGITNIIDPDETNEYESCYPFP